MFWSFVYCSPRYLKSPFVKIRMTIGDFGSHLILFLVFTKIEVLRYPQSPFPCPNVRVVQAKTGV